MNQKIILKHCKNLIKLAQDWTLIELELTKCEENIKKLKKNYQVNTHFDVYTLKKQKMHKDSELNQLNLIESAYDNKRTLINKFKNTLKEMEKNHDKLLKINQAKLSNLDLIYGIEMDYLNSISEELLNLYNQNYTIYNNLFYKNYNDGGSKDLFFNLIYEDLYWVQQRIDILILDLEERYHISINYKNWIDY